MGRTPDLVRKGLRRILLKMWNQLFILAVIFVSNARAQNCTEVLDELGLNHTAPMIAHATHSLTLNMIRHYFNPNADENNNISTVNLNRREPNHLHDHALLIDLEDSFDYPPFFEIDYIFSNMDDRKFGIKHANVKDRIVHAIHMHRMWEKASSFYEQLLEIPPADDVCACLISTHEEDIMNNLLFIAKQIRIPDQLSAGRKGSLGSLAFYSGSYSIGTYNGAHYSGQYSVGTYNGRSRNNNKLDLHHINIKNEATWKDWKKLMQDSYPEFLTDIAWNMAYYMYCKLED